MTDTEIYERYGRYGLHLHAAVAFAHQYVDATIEEMDEHVNIHLFYIQQVSIRVAKRLPDNQEAEERLVKAVQNYHDFLAAFKLEPYNPQATEEGAV